MSAFIFFLSCQKQFALDIESSGTLNCDNITSSGVFIKNNLLNDSNYINLNVAVTSPGSYHITTDTINGYFFQSQGEFQNAGNFQIKLFASGTPLVADTDHFIITYNQSFCKAMVTVVDTTFQQATYTFDGAPGICGNDSFYGSFIKAIPLDSDAKVKINLNVLTPGSYSITTNTVNGYTFSGAGVFSSTGVQSIFLQASGTPLSKSNDLFTVNAGSSSCSFIINVLTPLTIIGDDYFPLTANDYWTYDDLINKDTIKKTVVDSITISNNLYKIIQEETTFGGPYDFYYRESSNNYFEYASPNEYTTFFQYKKPIEADIPILKENLVTGSAWQSPEYADTTTDGTIINLQYEFSCLNNNATVAVNGKAFSNVYEIRMLPKIKSSGDNYSYTNEQYLFYYAKGVGLIYLKKTLSEFTQEELAIRNWQVY